jgi:hypothetical protein
MFVLNAKRNFTKLNVSQTYLSLPMISLYYKFLKMLCFKCRIMYSILNLFFENVIVPI